MDDDSRARRRERLTGRILAVASVLYLASYAVRVLADGLPDVWRRVFLVVMVAAWAVFAVEYVMRWHSSGLRLRFVRMHWLDTLVLLLPLLRPLQVVRHYVSVQRHQPDRPRLGLHARVAVYTGLSVALVGFAGSLAVYHQERGAPGATIHTFGDSVWWTCSTLATVGYGDVAPVTPLGRVIAVWLMICGLGLLGVVAGSFSSWLVQAFAREDERRPSGD